MAVDEVVFYSMKSIFTNIYGKLKRFRLQPIRVFFFHQVSEQFDASTMWECDWTQMEQFKHNIIRLKEQYEFISLTEATKKLNNDVSRRKKYAALTADDGWSSLKEIIPWLTEQKIPITLFVNPAYLLGEEVREKGMDKLLSVEELVNMYVQNKPFVSIASHGWNHQSTTEQSCQAFQSNINRSMQFLSNLEGYIPYFAYPCGKHSEKQDEILKEKGLIPVYCDGRRNYGKVEGIHRESIDGRKF